MTGATGAIQRGMRLRQGIGLTAFSHKRTTSSCRSSRPVCELANRMATDVAAAKAKKPAIRNKLVTAISIRSRCRSRCEGPAGIRARLPQQCAPAASDQTSFGRTHRPRSIPRHRRSPCQLEHALRAPVGGKACIVRSPEASPKSKGSGDLARRDHTDDARMAQRLTCRPVCIPKLGEDSDLLGPVLADLAQQIAADKAARHLDQHHGHQRDTKRTVEFVTAVDQSQDRTDDPAVDVPGKQTPHGHAARDHVAQRPDALDHEIEKRRLHPAAAAIPRAADHASRPSWVAEQETVPVERPAADKPSANHALIADFEHRSPHRRSTSPDKQKSPFLFGAEGILVLHGTEPVTSLLARAARCPTAGARSRRMLPPRPLFVVSAEAAQTSPTCRSEPLPGRAVLAPWQALPQLPSPAAGSVHSGQRPPSDCAAAPRPRHCVVKVHHRRAVQMDPAACQLDCFLDQDHVLRPRAPPSDRCVHVIEATTCRWEGASSVVPFIREDQIVRRAAP